MRVKWSWLLLFLLCSSMAKPQGVNGTGTIEEQRDAFLKPAFKVIFNLDFRRTFVNTVPVGFYGFRLGAQRNKDVIAVGFYGMGEPYVRKDVQLDGIGVRDLSTEFDYVGVGYERLLLDVPRWQIGVPVFIGLGNYRTSYLGPDDVAVAYSSNELVPLEATVQAEYNVFWWAFIGSGGGYRYVFAADREITISLSDWTYYIKVGIRFGEMVKRTRRGLRKKNDE